MSGGGAQWDLPQSPTGGGLPWDIPQSPISGGAQWGVPEPTPNVTPLTAATDLRIVDCSSQDNRYDLFDVCFYNETIRTMLTSDPDMVARWITETECEPRGDCRGRLLVGLDVEWRPSFNRFQQNSVATLQLCVGHRCLIFQLLYCPVIPNSLVDFLAKKDCVFVGVGIQNDVEKLEEDHELKVGNVVDLRELAADAYAMRNLKNAGLKELCNVVLGVKIEKPTHITMGRWDRELLNLDQVQYACVDVFVSFEIGRRLNAGSRSN